MECQADHVTSTPHASDVLWILFDQTLQCRVPDRAVGHDFLEQIVFFDNVERRVSCGASEWIAAEGSAV